MKTSFDMWFEKRYGKSRTDVVVAECKHLTKKGWLACKKEVLKILKSRALPYNDIFCSDEAIERIENL